MSNEQVDLDMQQITSVKEPVWFTSLVSDTAELDRTGVNAAVLSIRLQDGGDSLTRRSIHVENLLRRVVRPTDRVGQMSPTSFSLLLTPLQSIADATSHVHAITKALRAADLTVSAGYAQRRAGESLVDTWARAEAQADRAAFRAVHSEGLNLVE